MLVFQSPFNVLYANMYALQLEFLPNFRVLITMALEEIIL